MPFRDRLKIKTKNVTTKDAYVLRLFCFEFDLIYFTFELMLVLLVFFNCQLAVFF